MRTMWRWLLVMAVLWSGQAQAQLFGASEADFLPPEQAFVLSAQMKDPHTLQLDYRIADAYYMYRERFVWEVEPVPLAADAVRYPDGLVKYDPTFEKDMEIYYGSASLLVALPDSDLPLTLRVGSQGCADAGLCYPPRMEQLELTPTAEGYELVMAGPGQALIREVIDGEVVDNAAGTVAAVGSVSGNGAEGGFWQRWLQSSDTGLMDGMLSAGTAQTVLIFFALGILLAFTPCVLPMVPILSALLVRGEGVEGGPKGSRARRGGLLALAYVAGMSVVYTALGVAAGLSGVGLAAWLQTPWVLTLFALLLAGLALAMFDVFTFQVPGALQSRLNQVLARMPGGQLGSAALIGAISALIVGPCVAAPLAGALLYISQTGDVWLGGAALFALSWGMGVPLLIVGAASPAWLPRPGAWMDRIKRLFGWLLLATAWWMVSPVLPVAVLMLGWAALAIMLALLLGLVSPWGGSVGFRHLLSRTVAILLLLLAAAWVAGALVGARDPWHPLAPFLGGNTAGQQGTEAVGKAGFERVASVAELEARLRSTDRPVMLDFYADWCVSCKEMERFTFSDPAVAALMGDFLLLQADVTANTAQDRELLRRFRLFGPPGIIFFDAQGQEQAEPRVIGFMNAQTFAGVLEQVR
ncbi:protein-disulfide reductase DsbD [Alcaligenaceae bacterium SJ-26]|nr:protein-disulfide reductase DsbD [Alcaligenaceae bacterium SJ-26]